MMAIRSLPRPIKVLLMVGAFAVFIGVLWANSSTRAQLHELQVAVIERVQPVPLHPELTEESIVNALASARREHDQSPFLIDEKLRAGARVLAAMTIDRQTPQLTQDDLGILKGLGVPENTSLSTYAVFIPQGAPTDLEKMFDSMNIATASAETRVGVGLIAGEVEHTKGQALVFVIQSPLPRTKVARALPSLPSYSSDELWQAVEQYRDSHNLFAFNKNEDLCTFAQLRAQELAKAGELDGHAGFRSRTDQFAKDHSGWLSLSENLASGYETATQAVEWGWDKSQGHQALLKSIENPEACARVKDGFAVLITGRK